MIDYIWWLQVPSDIVDHSDSLLLDDVRFKLIFYLFLRLFSMFRSLVALLFLIKVQSKLSGNKA